ncbi:hypothetical protein [Myceligenerans indicum]|uniref:Uncharacterized protein n=1 Tax=Myceligenerans indicum TaxID=2593663 RepID=A0ABS1LPE1_9MICO|nr:hypothetical protein [Myceligenerans indicum]MBL0888095.1 hypothetical protein [Myceligenerans indicum]
MTTTPQAVPEYDEAPHATRHGRALGALRAVEARTGVRTRLPLERETAPDAGLRPVRPEVAALLPGGGLAPGTTVVVSGSTTLLLTLLAAPSRAGAWTAFVGHPQVGMAAAAEAGCELERTVCVPDPGPDAPAVLAALLDALDLVVVGPGAALLDTDRRRLTARTRERGAVLVVAQDTTRSSTTWPGAQVVLAAGPGRWEGIDHGAGSLCRRTLTVHRTGRGRAARQADLYCVLA